MKKILLILAVLILCAAPASFAADWSNPNPLAGGEGGGDTAGQLLLKHESTFSNYLFPATTGYLNQLKSSFSGAGSPASPNTGQIWHDSSNNYIKFYNSSWGNVGLFSSGTSSLTNIYSSGISTFAGTAAFPGVLVSSGTATFFGSLLSSDTATFSGPTAFTGTTSISSATTSGTWTNNITTSGTHTVTDGNTRFAVADGTAPFSVPTTTTKVANLHSDYLDGFHASQTPGANIIPVINASGDITLASNVAIISSVHASYAQLRNARAAGTLIEAKQGAHLLANAYFDGTNDRYYTTGTAAFLGASSALGPIVKIAPSGTADGIITWDGTYKVAHEGAAIGPYAVAKRITSDIAVTDATYYSYAVLNGEDYDSHGFYNTTTGVFQPTIAGMYLVTAHLHGYSAAVWEGAPKAVINKSGTIVATDEGYLIGTNAFATATAAIYMNGSTDTVKPGWFMDTNGIAYIRAADTTYFSVSKLP
jgi:hypothetical protein